MYILRIKLFHSFLIYHPPPNTHTHKKRETNKCRTIMVLKVKFLFHLQYFPQK